MEDLMRKLITLSFAILLSVACMGQEKLTLKSRVVDSKTRNDVPGVTVQLLSSDSTVIESLVANNHWTRDDQEGYSYSGLMCQGIRPTISYVPAFWVTRHRMSTYPLANLREESICVSYLP